MADWFATNAPSQSGSDWFAANAPGGSPGPGVPNPLRANPDKYTPAGLRPGDRPLPSTTVGAEALRNLPGALIRYASPGPTAAPASQAMDLGHRNESWEQGASPWNLLHRAGNAISDTAGDVYHTFSHPLESFAQDPVATVNTPAMIRAGGKGAREAVNATGAVPVVSTIAKGAREGVVAELPQIKNWSKWGAIAGLPLGMGTGDIATRVLGASEGGGIGGAVAGGARAIPAAVRGAKGALARRAATTWVPRTEGYMPPVGEGASPRPVPPPPSTQGPMRGPDWWEAYQQELRSQPPPQEPYYPPPPEPTYIEPPPPPAAIAAPVGPRLPEGWEPTIPDYMKPGAETAEQMAARHEAEAAAASAAQPTQTNAPSSALDDIAMSLAGKKYARLDANGQATVQKIAASTAPPPSVPPPPSPDQAVAQATGGAYKKFAQAPESVKKTVAQTVAPAEAPPAPSISQPLGKVAPLDRETNLVNMLRANTTRKNLEIGQYFAGRNLTPEAVATMPEAEFNAHVRNVKNASGNAYEPSTGRNYHRTFEQARAEVVKAMQEMNAGPVAPPPPPQ